MVHVDTWRAAYKGIVPETYLDGLSYDEADDILPEVITTGCVFVAEGEEILR